jgi:hypothetical protein
MATFIDESGDTGLVGTGALPYFRLAAAWVADDAVEQFRESVRIIRQQFRLKPDHEFKFARTHNEPDHRHAFFRAAMANGFRFAACAIDKTVGEWRSADAPCIHWACATSIASCLRDTYRAAEAAMPLRKGKPQLLHELVVVDQNQDANYLGALKQAFRGLQSVVRQNVSLVGKVKFRGSGSDELIQLADMTCGAVGASLEGNGIWYQQVVAHCVGLIVLP